MSSNGTMKNFKAMLADARLPERTVQICLRGDLVADHEAAERDLEQAQKATNDSLAGSGVGALVERIEALEAEMREHTYDFRLRALPRPKFRALVAEHPPRKGEDGRVVDDDVAGVNADTFYDTLIQQCLVDPELTADEFSELADVMTSRQYDDLASAAWQVNRFEVDVPFSLAASRAKRDIGVE